jgi:hypothetical protein
MNCAESEQFFDAYLDGELCGSLRLEFDAHRLRCPACQQKLAMMESCEHILSRDDLVPTLSDDFTDRVMNEIEQRRFVAQRSRRRRITIAATVALQAAAVVVFAVLWSGILSKPSAPAPEPGPLLAGVEDVLHGEGDREQKHVEMVQLIFAELEKGAAAAQSNLKNDVSNLARYATSLSVFDDLSSLSEPTALSPLDMFLQLVVPAAPEAPESTSGDTDPFSL